MQKTRVRAERNKVLAALAAGAALTVSLAYFGHDPGWFVPLVLLLMGGGLAFNYYHDRIGPDLWATSAAVAVGGVVGMIYFLSLGAIAKSLGDEASVASLPLPIGLSLLYLPGWGAGACLGWWAARKRQIGAV